MRNVVHIETFKRTGSGVLLKCDVDIRDTMEKDEDIRDIMEADEDSYIVLTNYHVIQDLNQGTHEQKDYVDLKIKDVDGEFINSKFITHVFAVSGNNYDSSSDIAALLVIIKKCCKIVCSNDIYMGTENNLYIESEGYPHVFQNDLINRELSFKGEVKKYNREGIGIYKIADDYHGYSDISDKALMEGLSGAPVYSVYENKEYLIGINQSVCNIGNGKNPFKMVYFLSIRRVLDWLRSEGIILYEYRHRNVKILWMKNSQKEEKSDSKKTKKVVLVGGSGAGKSSFMKTLCQNGGVLDSVGDGQTTRTTISYDLSVYCKEPYILIGFQNKKNFFEKRKGQIILRLIELNLCYRFGMDRKNIVANPLVYLQDIFLPLDHLARQKDKKKLNDLKDELDELIQLISKTLYMCEMDEDLEEYKDMIRVAYEKIITFLEKYSNISEKKECGGEGKPLLHKMLSKKKLEKYLKDHQTEDIDNYYESILQDQSLDETMINEEQLRCDFREVITKEDGFFDISEFYYLDSENKMQTFCEKLFEDYFLADGNIFSDWCSLEREQDDEEDDRQNAEQEIAGKEEIRSKSLYKRIEEFYYRFYERVAFLMKQRNINLEQKKKIGLQTVTSEDKSFISRCMRKVGRDSLSGIIESISIVDSFSNDYALSLHQNKMNHLMFFDTCGLDHIERGNQTIYFRNLFNEIKQEKEGQSKPIDAIIYIKKLDSEKPTELETTLPVLNQLEEATPVFCIFTAVDQFLSGKEMYIDQLTWDCEGYKKWKNADKIQEFIFPKIIVNMHENPSFVNKIKAPEQIRNKIYRFFLNHMVPFSSRYQINDDQIIDLNTKSLSIIFKALLKDEWNIGFIPSFEGLDDRHKGELQEAIGHDLRNMFLYASRCDWQKRHPSTVRANFRRIYRYSEYYDKNHEEMGFNRTNIDRWDNLLQQGFSESFLNEGKTLQALHDAFGISLIKAYSILARIKNVIITDEMGKWKPEEKSEYEQSEFRKYFKEMYKNKEAYTVDVFERQENPKDKYGKSNKIIEFLNEHCNFLKGLEMSNQIEIKMIEYFCLKIEEALQTENKNYFVKLQKYDLQFKNCVEYIEKTILGYSDEKFIESKTDKDVRRETWEMIARLRGN